MLVGFEGIALSYLGYLLCTYLAFWAGGKSPGWIWDNNQNLFPAVIGEYFAWYSWVIYLIGVVFAAVVLLLFGSMVCKIAYQQLKGDDFYSMGDAGGFLRKNWKAVAFSPFSLIGMLVFCAVSGLVIGLVGRIPFVGEWAFALTVVLTFFAALLTVYVASVFLLSLLLGPSVVGSTREDTMETVIQLFSTAWSQPWRLAIYEGLLAILVSVGTQVLAGFASAAFWLISAICGLGMGDKLQQMAGVALHYMPAKCFSWPCFSLDWMQSVPWVSKFIPQIVDFASVQSGSILWAGRLLAVMLIVVIGFVGSYSFATWSSGQTLIYIALRKKKDDENLLERKDEREEEEEERQRQREREEREKKEQEKKEQEKEKKDEGKEKGEEPQEEEKKDEEDAAGPSQEPKEEQ
jgi:hypothetical protein